MVDREDDLKIGIKSTAILFGKRDKLIIGVLQLITLLMLMGLGYSYQLGGSFYWSLLAVSALFVYQQWLIAIVSAHFAFRPFSTTTM